jgi:hypothetical protein
MEANCSFLQGLSYCIHPAHKKRFILPVFVDFELNSLERQCLSNTSQRCCSTKTWVRLGHVSKSDLYSTDGASLKNLPLALQSLARMLSRARSNSIPWRSKSL